MSTIYHSLSSEAVAEVLRVTALAFSNEVARSFEQGFLLYEKVVAAAAVAKPVTVAVSVVEPAATPLGSTLSPAAVTAPPVVVVVPTATDTQNLKKLAETFHHNVDAYLAASNSISVKKTRAHTIIKLVDPDNSAAAAAIEEYSQTLRSGKSVTIQPTEIKAADVEVVYSSILGRREVYTVVKDLYSLLYVVIPCRRTGDAHNFTVFDTEEDLEASGLNGYAKDTDKLYFPNAKMAVRDKKTGGRKYIYSLADDFMWLPDWKERVDATKTIRTCVPSRLRICPSIKRDGW
jgi:hypothetical protein